MSTIKQIEANRRNAAQSTGPRTTEGKSATRLNALKHGLFATDPIVPGEDPVLFEALRASLYHQFQPANPAEHILLASVIRDTWSLERFSTAETGMLSRYLERHYDDGEPHCVGRALIDFGDSITQVRRLIDAVQRSPRRNIELRPGSKPPAKSLTLLRPPP